jgi:hypothetical protein
LAYSFRGKGFKWPGGAEPQACGVAAFLAALQGQAGDGGGDAEHGPGGPEQAGAAESDQGGGRDRGEQGCQSLR